MALKQHDPYGRESIPRPLYTVSLRGMELHKAATAKAALAVRERIPGSKILCEIEGRTWEVVKEVPAR